MASYEELKKRAYQLKASQTAQEEKEHDDTKSRYQALKEKARSSTVTIPTKLNGSQISKWYSSASDVSKKAYEYLSSDGYKQSDSGYIAQIDSYLKQADDVAQYIRANRSSIGDFDGAIKNHYDSVNYLRSLQDSLKDAVNYYAQWDSADAYDAWYKKESFISDYLKDPQKATSTADYDDTWVKEAEERAEKQRVLGAEDYADNSRYVSTKADDFWSKMWSAYGLGYGDITYEYINNQNGLRDKIKKKSIIYRSDTKDKEDTFEEKHLDYMEPDEVGIYNYYYSKFGKEKAEEYLDNIGGTLEARANNQTVENATKFASEHPWISSAAAVATSLGSGFEYIEDVLEYGKDKLVGDPARLGTNEAALMTNTIRGTVSEKVDWEIGNWDAFDFLYGTAMSGIDSMVAGTVFGGFGGTVLGLSAAAQGTNDALARGMNDGQAFWNGLMSGVFEGLFETVSIGNFNKLKEIAPESVKDIIKNLGKSMLVNASEETLTEIANIGYDTLVNGEFANYTWEELKNGAWKDALWQVLEAGASGALMGVGMGGVGNAIGYFNGAKDAKQLYGGSQQELVGGL